MKSFNVRDSLVPLNWAARENVGGARAAIAIIKLPAKVSVNDDRYGGPVLFNPGGPGGSGIQDVISKGKAYQNVVSSYDVTDNSLPSEVDGKSFDFIGFDPRGVGFTTPHVRCFPNEHSKQVWDIQSESEPRLNLLRNEMAFELEWARSKVLGQSCSIMDGEEGMLAHVNTAQVVEDCWQLLKSTASGETKSLRD